MIPRSMCDNMNLFADFLVPKMLIQNNKRNAAIVKQLLTEKCLITNVKEDFPPEKIADEKNFISVLFYYGMITIAGTKRDKTIYKIPNREVEEQLLEMVKCNEVITVDYCGDAAKHGNLI